MLGTDRHRVGVLDEHRGNRWTIAQVAPIAGQNRAKPRLVEVAYRSVHAVKAFDQAAIERIEPTVAVERTAAWVFPSTGDGRQAGHRMHVGRTVARAGEAVADPQVTALGAAIKMREPDDLLRIQTGDRGRPFGSARPKVLLQLLRHIGIFL